MSGSGARGISPCSQHRTRVVSGEICGWFRWIALGAQMILLSAQGMPVVKIAEVTFTSADRISDVIHNFNTDGFGSLSPKYKGGRPKTFTLPERREIKKIVKSRPPSMASRFIRGLGLEGPRSRRVD